MEEWWWLIVVDVILVLVLWLDRDSKGPEEEKSQKDEKGS